MGCPADETILGFIEETLSAEAAAGVKAHVDGCAECRTLLVHAARSFFQTSGGDGVTRASQVGRYEIVDLIGAGGMGVIYRARDPLLNREVALKVLWRADGEAGRARLLGEAEAMARLAHPNVVTVYDAGTFLDRIFLAMERVEGQTLSDWLATVPAVRETVEAFIAAGRGLAAAHAAGLVHRDFKPANVLRGSDGRVRVTDFGLAVAAGDVKIDSPLADSSGTPAYMAPEQFLGAGVDARTDQFSFCVALYEALYGLRPFSGLTPDELRTTVLWGVVAPPPVGLRPVPRGLRRILLRGLSVAPAARHPSMDALLAALERELRPRGKWPALAALAVVAVAGLAGYLEFHRARDRRCTEPPLAGAWDDARKQAVHAGLLKSGAPYAESTWARAAGLLDHYAAGFSAAEERACQEPSGVLAELRLSCLDDRRQQLGAVAELLSRADATVLENAIESIRKLTPVEDCADAHALEAQLRLPRDRAVRAQVERFRRTLTEAEALERAGKYADGIALLQPRLERAGALGYLPLEAETLYRLGSLHGEAGSYPEAEALLQRAASAGEASGHSLITARAWIALVYFVGVKGERADQALEWNRYADAAIERLGGSDALSADRCFALGRLYRALGRANDALAQFERAGELYKKVLGDEDERVAETLLGMSSIYESEGRHKEAAEANARALEVTEKALGREHPRLIPMLGHLGVLLVVEGRFDDALKTYQRALAIGDKTVGSEHISNAQIHSELGQLLGRLGRFDEGRAHLETALRLTERAVGGEHADSAAVLDNLGTLYLYARRPQEALEYQQRALTIFQKSGGPDHPRVGRCLHHMSAAFIAEKKYAEALDCSRRALAITEKAYGPDGRDLGVTLTLMAEAQLGLGDPRAALESATRALALRQVRGASATSVADTRFVLGRATFDAHHDRAAARALVLDARDAYAAARGPRSEADLARVQAWLDAHGGRQR